MTKEEKKAVEDKKKEKLQDYKDIVAAKIAIHREQKGK